MLIIAIIALCATMATAQVDFEIYAFRSNDNTYPENMDANLEYHCVEYDFSWNYQQRFPRAVHGSYGGRGYFEGEFSWDPMTNHYSNNAYISFYEVGQEWFGLQPKTGAAALTYGENMAFVQGHKWGAGQSNISYLNTLYSNRCEWCVPDFRIWYPDGNFTVNGEVKRAFAEANCLWSPSDRNFWSVPQKNLNNEIFEGDNFTEVYTTAGVGPADTNGQLMGAYHLEYTEDQCRDWGLDCMTHGRNETGYYGLNAVSAYLANSRVAATQWYAVSGPMAGRNGSYVFTMRTNSYWNNLENGAIYGTKCVALKNQMYSWASPYLGHCRGVRLERVVHNKDIGRQLLNAYNHLVNQPKEGNVIYTLKWFANKVFGKWL